MEEIKTAFHIGTGLAKMPMSPLASFDVDS
jgi:hypothetical protein